MLRGFVIVVALGLGACGYLTAVPTSYTLKVDVNEHGKSTLCARTKDDAVDAAPDCEPWTVQPLSSPGTLTVELANGGPDERFDLRIEQFSREASQEDVQKLLAEVASRVTQLIRTSASKIGTEGQAAAVTKKILDELSTRLPESAQRIADELAAKPATPPTRPTTDEIFKDYLVKAGGSTKLKTPVQIRTELAAALDPFFNAPALPEPPVRSFVLTASDLVVLNAMGITNTDLIAHVNAWCTPASFTGGSGDAAAQHQALATVVPDLVAMKRALRLDPRDVARAILDQGAKGDPLQLALEPLLAEKLDWSAATKGVGHQFALMRLGTTLAQYLANCEANYQLLGQSVPAGFATLKTQAENHARAFRDIVGPIYATAVAGIETILPLLDSSSFTTLTLEPGLLELGVGRLQPGGGRTEFATYKVQVHGIERLAIFAGPIMSFCITSWHCYDEIHEGSINNRRHLVKESEWRDFGLATGLHVTLRSGQKFGIGAIVGYPLGAPNATSANVLAGLGLRHATGIELAFGVHAFRLQALRNPYRTPFDVSDAPGITIDSVTAPEVRFSGFVMLGFAPDIL